MPEPQPHPDLPQIRRVALHALSAGIVITAIKFGIFFLTNSAAVLSDAFESIINIVAAGFMLYSIWLANRPADRLHPYGHGKIEFMAVGLEGWLILLAGVVIAFEAARRLWRGVQPVQLEAGIILISIVAALTVALAWYVIHAGKRFDSDILRADGRHLMTDAASTLGVLIGLILVRVTGLWWLDPLIAIVLAAAILFTSWRLLWHSIHGLMDKVDPKDDAAIRRILDEEVTAGAIRSYHKVRHRHSGPFHWVDMHLQIDGDLTIREGHALASRIEGRIESELGQANATAHVEPADRDAAD